MSKISQYSALTSPATNDELVIVDVDDLTMAASGTTKNITLVNMPYVYPGGVPTAGQLPVATGTGQGAQWVTGSLTNWSNILAFGADASGTLDSTTAGQNAINALGAAGGVVYLPPGTFKVTPVSATVPAWTVPSNVMIMGDGPAATTILKNGNGPLIDFSGPGPISKTTNWNKFQGLSRLAINGNGKSGLVLRLYYVQCYYEHDVQIYGNADVSVDMVQCYDSRITNGLYQFGGSTSSSTISGGQAVFHLIRNSAAPATTLSASVSGTITSLPVVALPAALPAGIVQVWSTGGAVQNFTTTGAAASATSIPVSSTLVTITTAIGNTVNGFGWSGDSTNALDMFGCHWEDNLSGAVWITQGVNNTANVNNIHIIGGKSEQDAIGYNCPQFQVDPSTNGIRIHTMYHYLGGFNGGFSTPVTGIYFHTGYGSLRDIDMGNGGTATVSSGIDVANTFFRPVVDGINQVWNTSPTVAGISPTTGVVSLLNIEITGATTAIGNPGNYSIINDPSGNWNGVGSLAIGAVQAFGNVDLPSAGTGLKVAEGSNAKQGTATLNGTTAVVVANTSVTNNSRIFLTINAPGGTVGSPYVSARTAGTSFSIKSTTVGDTSAVAYEIFEPG